jgi:hypothetical protein
MRVECADDAPSTLLEAVAAILRTVMSAQIIQLSDHRKMRGPVVPSLIGLSLSILIAYLIIGAAIYATIFEAAQQGFKR